jgi:hypothetical protein
LQFVPADRPRRGAALPPSETCVAILERTVTRATSQFGAVYQRFN